MKNEILLGLLKSQLATEIGAVNEFNHVYSPGGGSEARCLCYGRIRSLSEQIKELEAIPDNTIDPFTQKPYRMPNVKPVYYVTDEFASDKGLKCRYYVRNQNGVLLNNNALHINDAELLCKLANN